MTKWRMSGGTPGSPSSPTTMPPRITQSEWSVPVEYGHWPVKRKPPSTRFARPKGAYGEAVQVSGSSPQISSWTRGSIMAISQGWTPTTPATQPADGEAAPISMTASMNSQGWVS